MKNNYIFTVTSNGDRTNIMSSFPLWNKQMFLDNVKQGKNNGRYRYGMIGGYISLLKEMYLEEFEQVFSPAEFTSKEITEVFRKEISEKYGEHAEKAKIKPLSKKELERGCVYEDFSKGKWLYYGEVEQIIDKTYLRTYQYDEKTLEINKGFGFHYYYNGINLTSNITVLKSPKKLMKKIENLNIHLEEQYIYETGRGNYSFREQKIILKLL